MKKTGLFYSFNTRQTSSVAHRIQEHFGNGIELVNAETLTDDQFLSYDNYIIGAPTWWDGELPNYWDEMVPAIEDMNLQGKTFALFGLGNQVEYGENFGDAIGTLADLFESRGAKIVGETSTDGYEFESSKAARGDKFVGLMIDNAHQPNLTEERVKKWTAQVKKAFK